MNTKPIPKRLMLGVLTCCYVLVSVVAYTDYPRRPPEAAALEAAELAGLEIWRQHNCQACHQIYGFGGFLGPDLTNRFNDSTPDLEIEMMVRYGQGRMPSFDLSGEEIRALASYLRRINRSGRSQPPGLESRIALSRGERMTALLDRWQTETGRELPSPVRAGCETWSRSGCEACHETFDVGRNLAPDVSGRAVDHSPADLGALLSESRGRMPAFPLEPDEIESLSAFLSWVSRERPELVPIHDELLGRPSFTWAAVPWFEYQ